MFRFITQAFRDGVIEARKRRAAKRKERETIDKVIAQANAYNVGRRVHQHRTTKVKRIRRAFRAWQANASAQAAG